MEIPNNVVEVLRKASGGEEPITRLIDLVASLIDPPEERVKYYLEASEWFWVKGLEEIERGDYRQGGEKVWNAVVQLVKAVAEKRGWPHSMHRLIWRAIHSISKELGKEVLQLFAQVEQLHANFYEGHLERDAVITYVDAAKQLINMLKQLL